MQKSLIHILTVLILFMCTMETVERKCLMSNTAILFCGADGISSKAFHFLHIAVNNMIQTQGAKYSVPTTSALHSFLQYNTDEMNLSIHDI